MNRRSLRAKNCDINKLAEKYAYYRQLKQRLTVHALNPSDLNNVKGKKAHENYAT
jgi:hypothetical protein